MIGSRDVDVLSHPAQVARERSSAPRAEAEHRSVEHGQHDLTVAIDQDATGQRFAPEFVAEVQRAGPDVEARGEPLRPGAGSLLIADDRDTATMTLGQTGRPADRQTGRPADRQTGRPASDTTSNVFDVLRS